MLHLCEAQCRGESRCRTGFLFFSTSAKLLFLVLGGGYNGFVYPEFLMRLGSCHHQPISSGLFKTNLLQNVSTLSITIPGTTIKYRILTYINISFPIVWWIQGTLQCESRNAAALTHLSITEDLSSVFQVSVLGSIQHWNGWNSKMALAVLSISFSHTVLVLWMI